MWLNTPGGFYIATAHPLDHSLVIVRAYDQHDILRLQQWAHRCRLADSDHDVVHEPDSPHWRLDLQRATWGLYAVTAAMVDIGVADVPGLLEQQEPVLAGYQREALDRIELAASDMTHAGGPV